MATTPMVHEPDCYGVEHGITPTLTAYFAHRDGSPTVRVDIGELCVYCGAKVRFTSSIETERRFHRYWKASMATYIATWEHRNGLWDDATR